jgi:hypothetical protein
MIGCRLLVGTVYFCRGVWESGAVQRGVLAAVAFLVKLFAVVLAVCAMPDKDRDDRSRAHNARFSEPHGPSKALSKQGF